MSSPSRPTVRVGDGVDRADQLDAVAHDVEDAAAAQPERLLLVDEDDRHGDRDPGGRADAHEVDMQRLVGRRVELHVARQGALHRAVDREIDEGREEAAPGDRSRQLCAARG